ncbi:ribosomal protein S18-alanine N-acetyltransferase [Porticoccus sp. W117]|uniref:ribosomal protein S18-alanine N-acetyltransferase n=1 Tax=Porticoccus sp. W117 TaxID=3054777 RepID=UPI0025974724|nr:ribosomal protein S18-alanine N-acetyltransferase [Porticoccus sp. W117]MDM3871987.1 ribosomal protein S18-alanine N-acetyltransferase [Porticoccus sp. W117]
MSDATIRPMELGDIEAVTAIEAQVSPHPWNRTQFQQSLGSSHRCWVLESSGQVIGYYLYSLVVGEAEILNIAVAPQRQGAGLGRLLLDHCLLEAAKKARMIFLEVRASNFAAIHLYLDSGFNQIGERRDYYRTAKGSEDALMMAKELV